MAWLGGAMLALLVIVVCLSILGRQANQILHAMIDSGFSPYAAQWLLDIGIGPIRGDFELIEAGVAFSIFAFLPYCHLTDGHARVDIFTQRLSARTNRVLRLWTDIAFAAALVLIAVQLFGGMQSKFRSGQTTFLLEFPLWWAYALSLIGAAIAALVSVFIAVQRLREAVTGEVLLPEMGPEH